MIRNLEVKGLNNRLDGAWEFNEDLNVITGRNGSGKTTLLKLIWYLISGNIERIIPEIPLRFASIETDSFSLSIQVESDEGEIHYQFANEDKRVDNFDIPLRRADYKLIDEFNVRIVRTISSSLFFPTFRRVEGGLARFSKYVASDDSVTYQSNRFEQGFGDSARESLQEAMKEISNEVSVFGHKFIASISTHDIGDLLTKKDFDNSKRTVELHVKLSEYITQKISERKSSDDAIPILDDIQKRVDQTTKERKLLLRPFTVLSDRASEILQYKGIRVSEEIILGVEDGAIEADKLSAGEKQLLSFLCYNTFSENTAIFIDEPELSLHVDWQRRLLPTLLEQETGSQFFVATHSPFIYGKYPDKEIRLHEDRGGE